MQVAFEWTAEELRECVPANLAGSLILWCRKTIDSAPEQAPEKLGRELTQEERNELSQLREETYDSNTFDLEWAESMHEKVLNKSSWMFAD